MVVELFVVGMGRQMTTALDLCTEFIDTVVLKVLNRNNHEISAPS